VQTLKKDTKESSRKFSTPPHSQVYKIKIAVSKTVKNNFSWAFAIGSICEFEKFFLSYFFRKEREKNSLTRLFLFYAWRVPGRWWLTGGWELSGRI